MKVVAAVGCLMATRQWARHARASRFLMLLLLCCAWTAGARAATVPGTPLRTLTGTAGRVVRAECVSAHVESRQVAGANLPVTVYRFRVSEYLKGHGPESLTFRQVGTPQGGSHDLGQLAGLPTYAPGTEYLLFLLPESRAGLSSPAGAGEGAFRVQGNEVFGVRARVRGVFSEAYPAFREAILREVRQ